MAEITETLILDIQFDSAAAIKETAELKNQVKALKDENKALFDSEKKVTEQYVKNEAAIKAINVEIRNKQKIQEKQIAIAKAEAGSNDQLKAQLSNLTQQYNALSKEQRTNSDVGTELAASIKSISDELKATEGGVGNFTRNVGDYEGAIVRASNSILGMKERLKELDATVQSADIGSKEFKDASNEASNLRLQIDQVTGKVNEFGEREPKNNVKKAFGDALITVGLLGQGINALSQQFTDNEDAQQALVKATQGVSVALAAANIIKEKGAIIDTVSAASTGAAAVAQGAYALAVGTSSGALKLFRLALLSTGIGAIIVALGFLIANFDEVTNAVTDFLGLSSEQERASKAMQENYAKEAGQLDFLIGLEQRRISSLDAVFDRQIKLAKAAGKDTIDIEERKAAAYQKTTKSIIDQVTAQLQQAKIAGVSAAEQIKLSQQLQDLQANLADSIVEVEARRIEANKKASDEAIKLAKDETAKRKTELDKRLADEQKAAEEELKIQNDLASARIALVEDDRAREILVIRKAAEDRAAAINSTSENAEALRVAIFAKAEQDIAAINAKFTADRIAKAQEVFDKEQELLAAQNAREEQLFFDRQQRTLNRVAFEEQQRLFQITSEEAQNIKTIEGLNNLVAVQAQTGLSRQEIEQQYFDFFETQGEITYDQYLQLLNDQVAAQAAATQEMVGLYQNFGTQLGDIFANSLLTQGEALKGFGKQFLILILDTLQKQILASSVFSVADSIAKYGPVAGGIRSAISIAAIQAAFAAAKGRISSEPKGFAAGVVGLNGAGTSTSDSIPAMLSVGESVITANGTQYAQQNMPGMLEFLNSKHKFATGVVDFQNNANIPLSDNTGLQALVQAIGNIEPVVKVTDINKKQTDYTEVRVTGNLT
jgi:hypothetical protein